MEKVASATFGANKYNMSSSQTCNGLPPKHHPSSVPYDGCRTLAQQLLPALRVSSHAHAGAAMMSIQTQIPKGETTASADNSRGMLSDGQLLDKPTMPASSHPQPKMIRSSVVPMELGCGTSASKQPTRGITLSNQGLAFVGGGVTLPNHCIQQMLGPKGTATPLAGKIPEPSTTTLPARKVVTITSSTPRSIPLRKHIDNVLHSSTSKACFNVQQLAMERRTNSAPGLLSQRTTSESTSGVKTKYKYQKVFGGKQDVELRRMSLVRKF
jgi:hypothetical protein